MLIMTAYLTVPHPDLSEKNVINWKQNILRVHEQFKKAETTQIESVVDLAELSTTTLTQR